MCYLGLVNQPIKSDTKWLLTFETDYQRLFETEVNQAAYALLNSVNTKIILTSTSYILVEQFNLDDNYRARLEDAMISNHILRTGIKTTPYQKSYKLVTGSESRTATFEAFNEQFSFLEICSFTTQVNNISPIMIATMQKLLLCELVR